MKWTKARRHIDINRSRTTGSPASVLVDTADLHIAALLEAGGPKTRKAARKWKGQTSSRVRISKNGGGWGVGGGGGGVWVVVCVVVWVVLGGGKERCLCFFGGGGWCGGGGVFFWGGGVVLWGVFEKLAALKNCTRGSSLIPLLEGPPQGGGTR